MPRPGRRGGDADTRGAIIAAARAEFGDRGYNAATLRAIARRAEVDPALIYHFFGDKPTLYAATLNLPADPRRIQSEVRAAEAQAGDDAAEPSRPAGAGPGRPPGPRGGAVLVQRFLAQWENGPGEPGQRFITVVQATSSSPEVARSVREFLFDRVWGNLPGAEDPDTGWRRTVVSSVLLGMAFNRYVLRTEPIASAPLAEVAAWFGPVLDNLRAPVMRPGTDPPVAAD